MNPIEWLTNEIKEAEKELDLLHTVRQNGPSAKKRDTSYWLNISYWQGYFDAMNNAAAAYYGPTPLEGDK